MNINADISSLKGIGPKMAEKLNKCGIFSIMDLLLYFPKSYDNIASCPSILETQDGDKIVLNCMPVKLEREFRSRSGRIVTRMLFFDGKNNFYAVWFNQPYIKNKFNYNSWYKIMGKVKKTSREVTINNPVILNGDIDNNNKIVPKYALSGTLKNSFFIRIILELLKQVKISENMPKWIVEKYNFYDLDRALRGIHSPKDSAELMESRRRLKFQELFTYSLKILMLKEYVKINNKGFAFKISPELKELKEKLPFKLTGAQNRAIREVLIDEKKPNSMNRLVQGDVGSGKTVVALIALFNVIKNGYQGALMAPTEILANQHFKEASNLFRDFEVRIEILTGSVTAKKKNEIKERLKGGEIDLIIGTHALIEDNVEFKNLGMIVTDELHRFGVMQRNKLFNKGNSVDVLVMTATPIPRTLSLYLYGDLDVSIIDELPPGRKKIETYYIKSNEKSRVYNFALKQIEEGRQVYVVCPLVEENDELKLTSVEKLYDELKSTYFKDVEARMLHGKMSAKDKENIMNEFKDGEVKVLVSTTVIEVGVNVPNASVMIIENAERFGLAQLHQLRGRVGRGKYSSYCILIAELKNKIVEKRMKIISESTDGFYISEQDLKLRGSGEVFGIKQSGDNELIISDVIDDIDILKLAHEEAKKLILSNSEEDIRVKKYIAEKLKSTSRYICFN